MKNSFALLLLTASIYASATAQSLPSHLKIEKTGGTLENWGFPIPTGQTSGPATDYPIVFYPSTAEDVVGVAYRNGGAWVGGELSLDADYATWNGEQLVFVTSGDTNSAGFTIEHHYVTASGGQLLHDRTETLTSAPTAWLVSGSYTNEISSEDSYIAAKIANSIVIQKTSGGNTTHWSLTLPRTLAAIDTWSMSVAGDGIYLWPNGALLTTTAIIKVSTAGAVQYAYSSTIEFGTNVSYMPMEDGSLLVTVMSFDISSENPELAYHLHYLNAAGAVAWSRQLAVDGSTDIAIGGGANVIGGHLYFSLFGTVGEENAALIAILNAATGEVMGDYALASGGAGGVFGEAPNNRAYIAFFGGEGEEQYLVSLDSTASNPQAWSAGSEGTLSYIWDGDSMEFAKYVKRAEGEQPTVVDFYFPILELGEENDPCSAFPAVSPATVDYEVTSTAVAAPELTAQVVTIGAGAAFLTTTETDVNAPATMVTVTADNECPNGEQPTNWWGPEQPDSNDWVNSAVFGSLNVAHGQTVWSVEHGWIYVFDQPEGLYFYDWELGFLYTSIEEYPFMYSYSLASWLWYFEGTGPQYDNRVFYRYAPPQGYVYEPRSGTQ